VRSPSFGLDAVRRSVDFVTVGVGDADERIADLVAAHAANPGVRQLTDRVRVTRRRLISA
jgi:hypothetical protein